MKILLSRSLFLISHIYRLPAFSTWTSAKPAFFVSFFLLMVCFPFSFSQENPKIDVSEIISRSEYLGEEFIVEKFNEAEKYYQRGYYEGSYRAFKQLYAITDEVVPLNYKMGVSALLGGHSDEAVRYLLKSLPDVTRDYYLQLGYAYQAALDYDRAKAAFEKYNDTLSDREKKIFRTRYNQLIRECEYGMNNAADSIPAFVINMGPAVNSYFDDYAAVENSRHERIFYTSKRPDRLSEEPQSRENFEERVLVAAYTEGMVSEGIEVPGLNNRFNTAVAGISPEQNFLFVYKGKKRSGQIRLADITEEKTARPFAVRHRIDKKTSKETTLTEANGGTVFFVSDRWGGVGGKDIWVTTRKRNDRFTRPQNIGPEINTPLDEEAVYVTPDGQTLFFASNGHPGLGGFDIFKTEKNENGEWTEPVNIGQPYNSPHDDLFYHPSASDSLVVFLSSSRPGGYGGLDLYKIKRDLRVPFYIGGKIVDGQTREPVFAQLSLVNTVRNEQIFSGENDSVTGEFFISLEDTAGYILQAASVAYKMQSARVPQPERRHDTVILNFEMEKLKHPYTVKGIITDKDTGEPVNAEIFFADLETDSLIHRIFSEPETGKYAITFEDKINVEMTVSAENYYSYSSELLLEKTIGKEEVKNIALEKSVIAYTLSGKVTEENSGNIIPAELAVFRPGEDDAFEVCYADSVTGKYSLTVYERGPFLVEVNADGYFFRNMPLQFHPDTTLKVWNIELQPMSKGASIVVENILFTTGKATLRAESYAPLNRLVRLLRENPSVRIEVSGHTDNTGSASLNKRLSRARALTVKRYLESQGIAPDRIEYEGYGFDRPIAPNTTAEGRAQNRRVEIEVIN
ncbi:MAG: flagellar motor protein MotB [Anaerophaga sp.]|nr:flagellar motor protein MotB [Anaerophaga sp.]